MAKLIDITNQRFNMLNVVKKSHKSKHGYWLWECLCDCGNKTTVLGSDLKSNHTKSCGCLFLKKVTKHGQSGRKGKRTLTYNSWAKMIARCYNPNCTEYKWYGAIGRNVCKRWREFENFLEDMGERPSVEMTLDRNPSSVKQYNKKNCRWADKKKQARNQMGQPNKTSKYKGVRLHDKPSRWTAQLYSNKKQIYLGYFYDEKEAARAYDKKAFELWGEDAYLNNV